MRQTTALMIVGLTVSFAVSACTTVEYVEITPQCTPPSQPALPSIDMGETWDLLGDERYRVLERYINGLWAYSDEQGALLDVLCAD